MSQTLAAYETTLLGIEDVAVGEGTSPLPTLLPMLGPRRTAAGAPYVGASSSAATAAMPPSSPP